MSTEAFGIDIGGSGIKGAPVDLSKGELADKRKRLATPQPSVPDAVADTVAELIESFSLPKGRLVGATFPAVIQHGVARTAANVDDSWIGTDVEALLSERTGHRAFVVNDADAAGIAEMEFGAGRDAQKGVVLMTTLGTGVGSALFSDGRLVPNTEMGHIPRDGESIEKYMADSAREREDLDWDAWAERLQEYYALLEFLFSPDLIIVGGGVSKKHKEFLPKLSLRTPIVPAKLRNEAGIIGAAALARRAQKESTHPAPAAEQDSAQESADAAQKSSKKAKKAAEKARKAQTAAKKAEKAAKRAEKAVSAH